MSRTVLSSKVTSSILSKFDNSEASFEIRERNLSTKYNTCFFSSFDKFMKLPSAWRIFITSLTLNNQFKKTDHSFIGTGTNALMLNEKLSAQWMNFLLQEKTLKEGEKKAVSDDENYFPFNNKTIKTFSSSTYILDFESSRNLHFKCLGFSSDY